MKKLGNKTIKLGILNKILRNIFTPQRKINMLKKAIAVLSIAFFSVSNVLPFVPVEKCNMSSSPSQTISDEIVVKKVCLPALTECNTAIYLPVVTAPFSNFKIHGNYSRTVTQNSERVPPTSIPRGLTLDRLPLPESPPAYQTPLLI